MAGNEKTHRLTQRQKEEATSGRRPQEAEPMAPRRRGKCIFQIGFPLLPRCDIFSPRFLRDSTFNTNAHLSHERDVVGKVAREKGKGGEAEGEKRRRETANA